MDNKFVQEFMKRRSETDKRDSPIVAAGSKIAGNNGRPPIPWVPEDDEPFSQWPGNPEAQAEDPHPDVRATSHERFELFNVLDALEPQPPIKSVVDKVITAGSLGVPYGEPGAKKTYVFLDLGVKVASGGSWLGFSTTQMPVLFIDEESGKTRLKRRLGEILRGEGINTNIPMYCFSMAGFHADDLNDLKILQTYIEEYHIGLVIIDALADIMTGDENSKEDTQPIFTALRRICDRTGATILIIHHSNKTGGYRGSSAIKGAVDLLLKVESEEGQNVVYFTTEKNRDADTQKWAAVCTWLDETFTLRTWDTVQTESMSKSQKYVLRFLEQTGTSTSMEDIENSADSCSASAARQAVYSLVGKNMVYRTNPGGRGTQAMFALVKKADDAIQF